MTIFKPERFRKHIVQLGHVYGGPPFWYEILREDANPDNIWRALLCIGSLKVDGPEAAVRQKLHHPDSRVRAWACFATGQLEDEAGVEVIRNLQRDSSRRVRVHAGFALRMLIGDPPLTGVPEAEDNIRDELILISEDSSRIQDQIAEALHPLEYRLAFASSEEETIEMALRLRPQILVTDNQKGRDNTSGLRMTTKICSNNQLKEIVLFMLTADPVDAAFLWHGGDYYLRKGPVALVALAYHVHHYLERSKTPLYA